MADKQLFSNYAVTQLQVGIDTDDTSLTVLDGSVFTTPGTNEYELLTLANATDREIVKLTARSGNTLTVVRAQEGSTALDWASGSTISGRITKGSLDRFVQNDSSITNTITIPNPILVKKDAGETEYLKHFAGLDNVIFSDEIDLTSAVDEVASINLPTGILFFVSETGVVVVSATGVSVQPYVEFGILGTTNKLVTATQTSGAYSNTIDKFTSISDTSGQTSLTFSVSTAGTATTLIGRAYWKGFLIETDAVYPFGYLTLTGKVPTLSHTTSESDTITNGTVILTGMIPTRTEI